MAAIIDHPLDHPFKPGTRVAVRNNHNRGYKENFVEKLHKTGRFTLRGSSQQYKAWRNSYDKTWSAVSTGDSWYYSNIKIWDETTDAEIAEANAKEARLLRWSNLRSAIDRMSSNEITDAMCEAIEAALPKKEGV